ncbi:MAG: hypothetical protein ACE1ZB_02730, partial [Gammaproteobacteria bacterium]
LASVATINIFFAMMLSSTSPACAIPIDSKTISEALSRDLVNFRIYPPFVLSHYSRTIHKYQ